ASWDRGEPLRFQLGVGQVISGWDDGVQGMKVGGRRRLEIPAALAYGDHGAPPVIAPGESLIFVCALVAVHRRCAGPPRGRSGRAEGTAGEHAGDPADGQAPLSAAPAVPVPEPSPPAAAPSDPGRAAATRDSGLRTTAGFEVVDELPVASVRLVGVLPHLDRPFEYAVTPETAAAGPGMRVRVRFSGKDTEGIVLARHAEPSTDRPLAPLHRLVSDDVVVPPALMRACEDVAERCAGTVGDVLRLALPPRHARAEKSDRAAEAKDA